MSVAYTPSTTSEVGVTWSITSGGTYATIDQLGVVTVLDGASSSSVTVRATSIYRSFIYDEITITVTYTSPSPMDDIDTTGLVFAYNLAKYPDGYTGDVVDDSGNNVVPEINGLANYETMPVFGFVNNALSINYYSSKSSSMAVTFPSIATEGSMTVELYAHLHGKVSYSNGSPGVYDYKGTTNADAAQDAKGGGLITIMGDNNMRLWLGPYKATYIGPLNVPKVVDAVLSTPLSIEGYNLNALNTDLTHIVISTSPTAVNVYVNGESVIATTNANREFSSKKLSLFTGMYADVKWVAAYNRAMDATEVLTNYQIMQDNYDSTSSE